MGTKKAVGRADQKKIIRDCIFVYEGNYIEFLCHLHRIGPNMYIDEMAKNLAKFTIPKKTLKFIEEESTLYFNDIVELSIQLNELMPDNSVIEFESEYGYQEDYEVIRIYVERMETDEEYNKRREAAKRQRERAAKKKKKQKENTEEKERKLLAKLKKKYED